jgi:hypothetical protein
VGWIETKIEEKLADLAVTVVSEGDRTRTEMAAALTQSIRGQRIDGARPRSISPNAVNVSAGGRLVGWSLQATGGPVRVLLHDSPDASGDVIAIVDLLDQENQTQWLGPSGVAFVDALYAECTGAGTPVGSTYIGAVD